MSLLNFNIRKIQKGGTTCKTGLDFIKNEECQTNVNTENGKLKIDGDKYTAYEIEEGLFDSLNEPVFKKYHCVLTNQNKLVKKGPLNDKKEITRFMTVVKKDSSLPQVKLIISNHNKFKREDSKKEDRRQEIQNPLRWNNNTNTEIKHTINGEEITKYKDIMHDGKKIAQMSVGRTNQYKNNTDLKSACTIFALKAIKYLLTNDLNKLTYNEIWNNGIEKDVAEKYRNLKDNNDVQHTNIFEAKKAFHNLESTNLELPAEYLIVKDNKDENILNFGKQNFDIINTFLKDNGDYGLVLTSNFESISITKKGEKYYFYESHPTAGRFQDKKIFNDLEYPNSVIIQFETIENSVSFIKERFPITNLEVLDQVAICKIILKN